MERVKKRLSGTDAALLLVVLIWGGSYSVVKSALSEVSPLAFTGARFVISSLVLIGVLRALGERIMVAREDLVRVALVGITGVGMYQIFFALGLEHTTASNSSLLIGTAPIWTALFAAIVGEERVTRLQLAGIVLSFIGVSLIIGAGEGGLRFSWTNTQGDLLSLMAGSMVGLGAVLSRPILESYSSLRIMGLGLSAATVFILLFSWPQMTAQGWSSVSWASWLKLGYASVLAAVVGYVLWYRGIGRLGATRTAVYAYLIPVVGVFAAVVFLGESFTPLQGMGALLTLVGVGISRLAPGVVR